MSKKLLCKIVLGVLLVWVVIWVVSAITLSNRGTTYEEWFTIKSPNSNYIITAETIKGNLSALAVRGSHRIRLFAFNARINERRELFQTQIFDDGGNGEYDFKWTEGGFDISFSGVEQKPITYHFKWDEIFGSE